jgi:hypothetical protein
MQKSGSIHVQLGNEMDQIEASFTPRTKGIATQILLKMRALRRWRRRPRS